MDAPTFRGINDRTLLLPNGRIGMWDLYRLGLIVSDVEWAPLNGLDEKYSWGMIFGTETGPENNNRNDLGQGPLPLWELLNETPTGFSGAFARQTTLSAGVMAGARATATGSLLDQLEVADASGLVQLQGDGVWHEGGEPLRLAFAAGVYYVVDAAGNGDQTYTRDALLTLADIGTATVTLTARLGDKATFEYPQPALWFGLIESGPLRALGVMGIPRLTTAPTFTLFGRHVAEGATVLVDGRPIPGSVSCEQGGALPNCAGEVIRITLDDMPPAGDHSFQVYTPGGLTSTELRFVVP